MALGWVCILTSECSLRGACPSSLEGWSSSSCDRWPAVLLSQHCGVVLFTNCLPSLDTGIPPLRTPNQHSNRKRCFWSDVDNERWRKEGQNPHQERDQEFRGQLGTATSLPTQCCGFQAPSNPGTSGGGGVPVPVCLCCAALACFDFWKRERFLD